MTIPSQAVVLAAGVSKRMAPFNQLHNKPQLVLMGKPILSWTLEALKKAEISNVVVVVNPKMTLPENYWRFWAEQFESIDVVVQHVINGQAGGIVAALPKLQSNFYVVNATNCLADELLPELSKVASEIGLLSAETNLPWLYGSVKFDHQTGLVNEIVEKSPELRGTGFRLVGVYHLTKEFVVDLADQDLTRDDAFEELLAVWAKLGKVETGVTRLETPTLKYPWHLLSFKDHLWSKLKYDIHPTAIIAPTAIIRGEVFIGAGAVIGDFAIVDGPAYIGAKAVVGQYCVVRKGSVLEAEAQIQRHGDVSNSILMDGAQNHSGFVGDSVIGQGTKIGAGFITANKRIDRQKITAHFKDKKIETGRTSLGALIGPDCKIGINVGTMPNVIIAPSTTVEPGTIVKKNLNLA